MNQPSLIFSDLRFPEGARWHEDRLWFSDMHTGQVFKSNPSARTLAEVAVVDDQPSGLGWLPDGSLLVSCMLSRRVRRVAADGSTSDFADLSGLTDAPINDLVTTPGGTTFLGGFGYDLYADAPQRPGPVFRIDHDGTPTVVEDDMVFPNGSVILPGTSTLVVAETLATTKAIGFLAMDAREFLQTDVILLTIIIYAIIGVAADAFARLLETKLLGWHPNFAKGAR